MSALALHRSYARSRSLWLLPVAGVLLAAVAAALGERQVPSALDPRALTPLWLLAVLVPALVGAQTATVTLGDLEARHATTAARLRAAHLGALCCSTVISCGLLALVFPVPLVAAMAANTLGLLALALLGPVLRMPGWVLPVSAAMVCWQLGARVPELGPQAWAWLLHEWPSPAGTGVDLVLALVAGGLWIRCGSQA